MNESLAEYRSAYAEAITELHQAWGRDSAWLERALVKVQEAAHLLEAATTAQEQAAATTGER